MKFYQPWGHFKHWFHACSNRIVDNKLYWQMLQKQKHSNATILAHALQIHIHVHCWKSSRKLHSGNIMARDVYCVYEIDNLMMIYSVR